MRPDTTLFLLMSVDGKITTGDNDLMDVDKDFPKIPGVREGLRQYYDIEQTTDLFSLNSGRVLAKIGINEKVDIPDKTQVSFVIVDNSHLTEKGIRYLSQKLRKIFLITTNESHPAKGITELDNLEVITYQDSIDFKDLFSKLKNSYGVDRMTIQTGGTLNAIFLRQGLIDHLSIVVAPCLIGGKSTPTLIDGESIHSENDLMDIKTLKLVSIESLEDSYIHMKYDVLN